jgi:hypothetical protein
MLNIKKRPNHDNLLKSQNTPFHEAGLNRLPARTTRGQAPGPLMDFLQIHQP